MLSIQGINKDIFNSAISTAIAEIITLPICTIKTNYQNTQSISIITTTKKIYERSGLKSFYNASIPAIVSQVFSTSSKYFMYRYFGKNGLPGLDRSNILNCSMLHGITSGVISSTITHPVDTIKIHLQMNTSFWERLKNDKIKFLYRGYTKSFGKVIISSGMFFPLFDQIKKYTKNSTACALISSIISTTIMQPIDYMKTRHIYGLNWCHNYDIRQYYRGYGMNLLRIVPHFTIMMSCISFLEKQ